MAWLRFQRQAGLQSKPFVRISATSVYKEKYSHVYIFSE